MEPRFALDPPSGARPPGPVGPVGPAGAVRAVARDLARLLVPVECPGCGRWDERCCGVCAAALDAVRRCETGAPRLDRLDGTV
ncbi:MAG TPA: hypothetical protein VN257_08230, partial [Actinotalea sp.]|nr:hypothetical protein [Actinotalea sp.]